MMNNYSFLYTSNVVRPWFIFLALLDLILRGIALYKSARKGQNVWFVFLLIINSMGVLPILYLLLNQDGGSVLSMGSSSPVQTKKAKKVSSKKRK